MTTRDEKTKKKQTEVLKHREEKVLLFCGGTNESL